MDQSNPTGPRDTAGGVRVTFFPTYREVRQLLGIWPGYTKAQITKHQSAIMRQTGTPSNPVDWSDPDTWIPEVLSGEDRELAQAIWEESGGVVNPRHTAGSWSLVRTCMLLEEGPNGNMQLTDRGHDFIAQPLGSAEAMVDEQEGLIGLLRIVSDRGPARFGALVEPWAKFLVERDSPFRSESTIRDTLRRRLGNLRDRDLLQREGFDYTITEAGLAYLKGSGPRQTREERSGKQEEASPSAGGFTRLAKSLENGGLLFSQEAVANYILALQTKRFAIPDGYLGYREDQDRHGGRGALVHGEQDCVHEDP